MARIAQLALLAQGSNRLRACREAASAGSTRASPAMPSSSSTLDTFASPAIHLVAAGPRHRPDRERDRLRRCGDSRCRCPSLRGAAHATAACNWLLSAVSRSVGPLASEPTGGKMPAPAQEASAPGRPASITRTRAPGEPVRKPVTVQPRRRRRSGNRSWAATSGEQPPQESLVDAAAKPLFSVDHHDRHTLVILVCVSLDRHRCRPVAG